MWRRCAAAVLGLVLAASAVLAQADEPGKWRTILDPSTRDGWEQVGYGSFVLEDGALKTEGGMGLLWYTKEKLGNCRIRVVYKAESETANSGVFVRIGQRPRDAWEGVHKGYEVQICDAADELHRTGAVYSMAKAPVSPAKPGEWNTLEIELRGEEVVSSVNGVEVTRFRSSQPVPDRSKWYEPRRGPRPESGYIGLQNHGGEDVVYFKEVSVTSLPH